MTKPSGILGHFQEEAWNLKQIKTVIGSWFLIRKQEENRVFSKRAAVFLSQVRQVAASKKCQEYKVLLQEICMTGQI
jgi:hypothetical protein